MSSQYYLLRIEYILGRKKNSFTFPVQLSLQSRIRLHIYLERKIYTERVGNKIFSFLNIESLKKKKIISNFKLEIIQKVLLNIKQKGNIIKINFQTFYFLLFEKNCIQQEKKGSK